MRTIRFSTGKLVLGLLLGIALPFMGLFMLLGGPIGKIIGLILIVGGPVVVIQSIKRLMGDGIALAFDRAGVTLDSGWSTKRFAWSDVEDIQLTKMTMRMYGFIPVSSQHYIDFRVPGGLFGTKKVRLSVKLLDIKKDEMGPLYNDLLLSKAGQQLNAAPHMMPQPQPQFAAPAPARAIAPTPASPETAPQSDFDPDEVMARYMARRAQEQEAVAQAQARAYTPMATPARPSFGRKVA
jgi:hypothetical protein